MALPARTEIGERYAPNLHFETLQGKRLDALEHDILEYVGAAGTSGASFEAIVLGTLPRHFGQVKVGKWAGDYARRIRKLIEHGHLRRQKDRLAAPFDRRERITVASASEEKRPAV